MTLPLLLKKPEKNRPFRTRGSTDRPSTGRLLSYPYQKAIALELLVDNKKEASPYPPSFSSFTLLLPLSSLLPE